MTISSLLFITITTLSILRIYDYLINIFVELLTKQKIEQKDTTKYEIGDELQSNFRGVKFKSNSSFIQ